MIVLHKIIEVKTLLSVKKIATQSKYNSYTLHVITFCGFFKIKD
jgi:hypothetical protein